MAKVLTIGRSRLDQLRKSGYRYASIALWPDGVMLDEYGQNVSTDMHNDPQMAISVCTSLTQEGFGCEGEYYPINVWVVDLKSKNYGDTLNLQY